MNRRARADETEVGKVSVDAVMNDLRSVIFDLRKATNLLEQTIAERTREGETGDASGSD